MIHILDRFLIHLFASAGVMLAVLFALRYLLRKATISFLPQELQQQITFVAISIFTLSAFREAWDIRQGQEWIKAVTDWISWALGCGLSAWGLIRVWKGKL